ncbi:exportin 1 [Trypanosoma theileri]|uniref:Exportin 1 n=1 Tax=Trypanosoma theileri TaxID=67003 RepID=A0A1X0P4N0_9TRYP|nr:exportin 1 [Trypanosoma theileri]ORC91791.1 exportin 1 [Trypanosoma theileri]
MRENVECSYGELYSLIRDIQDDSGVLHEQFLPHFTALRERVWSVPLVFIYGRGTLPSSIHPWRLCEVSRFYFPVYNRLKQEGSAVTGIISDRHPHTVVDEEQEVSDSSSEDVAIMASRLELVGTVFSIEVYQVVARNETGLQSSLKLEQYNQPLSSSILRIITNEAGIPVDEEIAAQRILQSSKDQLQDIFFKTFTPLLGATFNQFEKKWCDCVTGTLSHSDLESGGVSSKTRSCNDVNEEASLVSPNVPLEPPRHDVDSTVASDARNIRDPLYDSNFLDQRNESCVCNNSSISSGTTSTSTDLSLRWSALLFLFEQEERYRFDVVGAWARWTDGWDEVSRFAVVNSIDDIISSLGGSREAAHVSTAYLDVFLCRSQNVVRDSTYFSGVLLACAMLGCKQVDRFFPPIKSFLRCLRPESRITEMDFLRYEMHVLETLDFRLQPVTTLEIVEMLLHLCSGPAIQRTMEAVQRRSALKRWECPLSTTTTTNTTTTFLPYSSNSNSDGSGPEGGVEGLRWADVQRVSRLLADVMLRESRASAHRPPALALAIVAAAAAAAHWTLPASLRALLPQNSTTDTHHNVNNDSSCSSGIESGFEPDAESSELLRRYADALRTHGVVPLLPAAIELVQEWCNATTRRPLDGVLRRRYNINGGSDIAETTC